MLLLALGLNPVIKAENQSLKPFTTDYCTAWPEGTLSEPEKWKHCCLEHDLYLWAGGTEEERDEADLQLLQCVENTGEIHWARLMYWGVRTGARSPYRLPDKKWNNGWPGRPDFQALTREDIETIEAELWQGYAFIPPILKDHFINHLYSRLD